MIRFEAVTITYAGSRAPALAGIDLTVTEGELCLVVGGTGSGKSTLLRSVNGIVPRFTGGTLRGRVTVGGHDTARVPPRELADVVGVVGQDPAATFVADTVEEELAYSMENLGVEPQVMRRRVEDVLDLLNLHELRSRPLQTLSGGQQQRVAIGAVLTATPSVLVLDEPTSALDPVAAEEVLAALTRLVHDLGATVLVAEHRLERVVQYCDRLAVIDDKRVGVGDPSLMIESAPVAPPIVELGREVGWAPLPLSVRDARRMAGPLREELAGRLPFPTGPAPSMRGLAAVHGLHANYGPVAALRGVDLELHAGEIVALMGRNGSGKTTLLAQLVGLRAPSSGAVHVQGRDPHALKPRDLTHLVGLVPQDPSLLLFCETVDEECAASDRDAGLVRGTTRAIAESLVSDLRGSQHPRDLSEGQRLGLALAVVVGARPPLVLLDEPTRGLDYRAKAQLGSALAALSQAGHGIVLATHDVEMAAQVADRVVVLAEGEVVADGPAREVVCHSPVFAPQVAKILAPEPWLTVSEVRAARGSAAGFGPTSTGGADEPAVRVDGGAWT